jgi:hypothetical protein
MRRAIAVLAMLGVLLSNGCNKNTTQTASQTASNVTAMANNPVVTSLSAATGIPASQAMGGVGALLGLAQTNLASADWSKVAAVVPDASNLISQAKTMGGISKFTNLADLSGAFTKMGLTGDQVKTLSGALTDTVSKSAGPDVGNALAAAIK